MSAPDIETIYNVVGSSVEAVRHRIQTSTDDGFQGRVTSVGTGPWNLYSLGTDCGKHLQGFVQIIFPVSDFPFQAERQDSCEAPMIGAEVAMVYAECAPQMNSNGSIPADKLTEATSRVAEAARAMWQGVTCHMQELPDSEWSWIVRSMTPLEPGEAPFMGVIMEWTVGIVNRCQPCG